MSGAGMIELSRRMRRGRSLRPHPEWREEKSEPTLGLRCLHHAAGRGLMEKANRLRGRTKVLKNEFFLKNVIFRR